MLERKITNSTQLDFAERLMTSATEIYEPKGIPTGKTMPEYTQTQTTSQPICFDSAKEAQAQRKRNGEIQKLCSLTPQGRSKYFRSMQQKHKLLIHDYITELAVWQVRIEVIKMRPPTCADYVDKLKELYNLFKKEVDEEIPIEKYFANGPDDDMYSGAFLITLALKDDSSIIAQAVKYLSGIQWLIRERDKLPIEDTKPMPEKDAIDMSLLTQQKIEEEENRKSEELQEESADDDELLAMLEHFNIGAKAHKITVNGKSIPCKIVETSLMYMYQAEGKVWADTPESMSKKIIDVLPETKECSFSVKKTLFSTIAARIRRCVKESGNIHPDQMTMEKIKEKTGCKTSEATTIFNNWDGVLNAIVQYRDTIPKKQTDKLTTTYKTDNNLQN